MADEEEWMEKHRDLEGEGGKVMDTNTGGSQGYLSQFLYTIITSICEINWQEQIMKSHVHD